ncbi:hypothetical protein SLS60_005028 [Paraconiothyrium brasiliense]|uniref:Uncharacterized protein n=1 Tax=Paraconiothyrium brasiliense TaxID=300254 RepID=A0ABR3RG76_9PLEO
MSLAHVYGAWAAFKEYQSTLDTLPVEIAHAWMKAAGDLGGSSDEYSTDEEDEANAQAELKAEAEANAMKETVSQMTQIPSLHLEKTHEN